MALLTQEQLKRASTLLNRRNTLLGELEKIKGRGNKNQLCNVTAQLNGTYFDGEVIEEIAPVIYANRLRKIAAVDKELLEIGVEPGDLPPQYGDLV